MSVGGSTLAGERQIEAEVTGHGTQRQGSRALGREVLAADPDDVARARQTVARGQGKAVDPDAASLPAAGNGDRD